MGFYTPHMSQIGTGYEPFPKAIFDLQGGYGGSGVTDLRTEMATVALALQGSYWRQYTHGYYGQQEYSYRWDASDSRFIADGGNDIYDSGNFTSPYNGTTPSTTNNTSAHPNCVYYNQTTPLVHPTLSNYTYVSSGWVNGGYTGNTSGNGPSIVAATTGNSGYEYCGWGKGGNSGADGGGSRYFNVLYSGTVIYGFTVYAYWMATYNAGNDPSTNDVYLLIGHPNWSSTLGSNGISYYNLTNTAFTNSAMWTSGTGAGAPKNMLAVAMLHARPSGQLLTSTGYYNIISRMCLNLATEFGY